MTADLAEWKQLLIQAKRAKVKDLISLEIQKLENAIEEVKSATIDQSTTEKSSAPAATATTVKRYEVELTNYAWDQSDKYLKLFVTLDGVQDVGESNVYCEFADNSVCLRVNGLRDKNYKLIIKNLLEPIDTDKSYRKLKTNMIAIYAKKRTEGAKMVFLLFLCLMGFVVVFFFYVKRLHVVSFDDGGETNSSE